MSTIHSKLTKPSSLQSQDISSQAVIPNQSPGLNFKRNTKSALALAAFLNPLFSPVPTSPFLKGQTLYSCLGTKIAHLRKQKGWYQKDLAQATGISTSYISRLERGYHIEGVTLDILLKIAEVFEISLGQLFTFTKTEIAIAHYRQELHRYC